MRARKIIFLITIISALGISTAAAEKAESTVPHQSHNTHQGSSTLQDKENDSDSNPSELEVEQSELEVGQIEEAEPVEHGVKQEEHEAGQTEHEDEQVEHGVGQTEHEAGQTEQGHHEEVAETPPNYKVLGGFAAVNVVFIMIGVWMKWFRRKEVAA